jgi:hypothetical protein
VAEQNTTSEPLVHNEVTPGTVFLPRENLWLAPSFLVSFVVHATQLLLVFVGVFAMLYVCFTLKFSLNKLAFFSQMILAEHRMVPFGIGFNSAVLSHFQNPGGA